MAKSLQRRHITRAQVGQFVQAVRDSDRAVVDEMVVRLSRSRPWLAPLAVAVGAFAMLFDGVKLLFTNWRVKGTQSKRDKLTASAVGGVIGAVICTPPYALGRVGLIMLGSQALFILGVILFAIGITLQAGATGAVKTVQMSAKLVSGRRQGPP